MSAPRTGRHRLILYDLDGTLLDSFEDITQALNFALDSHGLQTHSTGTVKGWVGDGAARLVERALGADHPEKGAEILAMLKQHYSQYPAGRSRPYPGVHDTLDELRRRGFLQVILTNKPHTIALDSCARMGFAERVERVQGEDENHPLKPDPMAALGIAREMGVAPEHCLIVGDGKPDVALARACRMTVIGCTWGVATRPQMEAMAPDAIIDRFQDLIGLLDRMEKGKA